MNILNIHESKMTPRQGGQLKEMLHIADDFDAPLPSELLSLFYCEKEA